ncbi:hypothetical protein Mgra_00004604 [Meloidogyne graminicola]|uniref:Uncharacterized protein n=1 Tax=Meloidogyne graminicola TaxID=189291 RepID=A0A8S9ZS68_9BILA|nr:hypothetical protein Mgra_00004604 [Meloidogyne graminicola]
MYVDSANEFFCITSTEKYSSFQKLACPVLNHIKNFRAYNFFFNLILIFLLLPFNLTNNEQQNIPYLDVKLIENNCIIINKGINFKLNNKTIINGKIILI